MKKLLVISFLAIIVIVLAFLWMTRTPKAGAWCDDCHTTPTPTPIVYHYSTCSHSEDGYFCQSHTSTSPHESTCDTNKDCYPVTPTPSPIPTTSPTPTSTPEPCVGDCSPKGPNTPPSSTNTNIDACTVGFNAPILQGFKALGNGSVEFSWWGVDGADSYSITYGYTPTQLTFGLNGISGNATSVVLNGLQPGVNVWAKVYAWKGTCDSESNLLDPVVR